MARKNSNRIFGVLALAAGILLVMLEVNSYRGGGEVSYFWLLLAAVAVALGLYDIIARARGGGREDGG